MFYVNLDCDNCASGSDCSEMYGCDTCPPGKMKPDCKRGQSHQIRS